jgi:site-specific DNA recombinase
MTEELKDSDRERVARMRRVAKTAPSAKNFDRKRPAQWEGDQAAIYCRISHASDEDQTGVDRQERICRDVAERLGLVVSPEQIYVDNNRSAWKRLRKRKGWDALLAAAKSGAVKHIVAYHPDRLMRQPKDLEELLTIADDSDIILHGQANRRDLSDADDRFFLRIEVAHACRSSDDTSRRLKDAMVDQANDGKPHSGRRRYGYSPDAMTPVPAEAEIVEEIFARYLDGHSPRTIAIDLNSRKVPTTNGTNWMAWQVLAVLDSRHVAGIRVYKEKEIGRGEWTPIIDEGTFREAQERRTFRAAKHREHMARTRFYLLRSIVMCSRCGVRMVGKGGQYSCGRINTLDPDTVCTRSINADRLESFIVDAALHILENLNLSDDAPNLVLSDKDKAAIAEEKAELAEFKEMWTDRKLRTREYREMRETIEERLAALQARTVVRPTSAILKGVTGPNARAVWKEIGENEGPERHNAILRFLFAAVIVDANANTGRFDYSRIQVEANPL